jgi:peptidoglycan/xylan/chitin deacetylase (PgdA/CDA1 family)
MDFRLDRLGTLCIAKPLGWRGPGGNCAIPILMYHSITEEDQAGVRGYYRTATAPHIFTAQMGILKEAGYVTIGLGEAVRRLKESSPDISCSVVITFDDGFRDFYTKAAPVLHEHGFSATVFLPTAYIGDSPCIFKGKDCLTWDEVGELQKQGISFGSHTVNHPKLYGMSFEKITQEVMVSKDTIEQKTGCATESFAYPYAFPEDSSFRKKLRHTLLLAGYKNGVCTTIGRFSAKSDPLFIERLPVNSNDESQFFRSKLQGSYDWVARPQRALKLVRNWMESKRRGEDS